MLQVVQKCILFTKALVQGRQDWKVTESEQAGRAGSGHCRSRVKSGPWQVTVVEAKLHTDKLELGKKYKCPLPKDLFVLGVKLSLSSCAGANWQNHFIVLGTAEILLSCALAVGIPQPCHAHDRASDQFKELHQLSLV